jgi:hypothetical protein
MSCYNCGGCISTVTMNICFDDFTVTGLLNSTLTVLTFTNTADESISTATGTTNGSGELNIVAANMPDLIAGVAYKLETDQTWTLDSTVISCAIVEFSIMTDKDGVKTGDSITVVECG